VAVDLIERKKRRKKETKRPPFIHSSFLPPTKTKFNDLFKGKREKERYGMDKEVKVTRQKKKKKERKRIK